MPVIIRTQLDAELAHTGANFLAVASSAKRDQEVLRRYLDPLIIHQQTYVLNDSLITTVHDCFAS